MLSTRRYEEILPLVRAEANRPHAPRSREAVGYYDPPHLTFPFGTYICVVDIDKGTGEVTVHRFVAVDDCGNIINPMIVQGGSKAA